MFVVQRCGADTAVGKRASSNASCRAHSRSRLHSDTVRDDLVALYLMCFRFYSHHFVVLVFLRAQRELAIRLVFFSVAFSCSDTGFVLNVFF